jgi:putative ABC transport system permease protein
MEMRNKVCLLTKELAERIFPYEDPVGKAIRIGELRFTVIGVFKERVSTFGLSEISSDSAILPFPLMKYYTGDEHLRVLFVQARTPEDVDSVTFQVKEMLRARHPQGAAFDVQNLNAILDVARKIATALTIILLLIAFIALLISGIGIMNIMLVTVTERTREIGIRRAVGAPRSDILYQFLIEALLISGTGAVLGILIAAGLPVAVQPLLPEDLRVSVSWLSVVVAFLVSCSTGVFFGWLPANKAAQLHPVDSLRYE